MPREPSERALCATRRTVKISLGRERQSLGHPADVGAPIAVAAVSGGADSLALAAALAHEAPAAGWRSAAIIVDHGLQAGSDTIAEHAAEQVRAFGIDEVRVMRAHVRERGEGREAAARIARYEALAQGAATLNASLVLTGHTRDDQAEQVLLALARGSGTRALAAIPVHRELAPGLAMSRPFLAERPEIFRETTLLACEALGVTPWADPHNTDLSYARVRARLEALPALEAALGTGVSAALARTADLAREDAAALDAWAASVLAEVHDSGDGARTCIEVSVLHDVPDAVRNRVIRQLATRVGQRALTRQHTREISALVRDWHGQGAVYVPGARVERVEGSLVFAPQHGSPRESRGASDETS